MAWSKQVIKKVLFSLQHVLKLELHQFCFASLCSLFGIPNSISQTIQNWSLTISRVLGSLLCFLYFLFVFVCLFLFVRLFVCLFVFLPVFFTCNFPWLSRIFALTDRFNLLIGGVQFEFYLYQSRSGLNLQSL